MKRILALTICVGLASSVAAIAKPKDKEEKKERRAERKMEKAAEKFERSQVRGAESENRFERRVENRQPRIDRDVQPRLSVEQNIQPQVNVQQEIQPEVRRTRRASIERRGPRNYSWSYDEARRYHRRGIRRDRSWYQSNYNRFALFGGGYYYFDRGYWYPAYGYDPAYTTYRFDEPIYGYNSLEPGQVLVNVQRELRREGYYRGAIDGLIGPMTRAALARYQRDSGLYVTRAVDGPTLAALGLT